MRNVYKMLVRKCEGKRMLGGPRCRWEDNIRMDIRDTGWEGVDWMLLVQDRDHWWTHVNPVMNLWVP
jgi:hypothetical protein